MGDTVYIQEKGEPITTKATVSSATSKPYGDIEEIRKLCKSSSLFAANEYWLAQRGRQYGTVVWLTNHRPVSKPIHRTKVAKGNAHDWIVLDTEKKRQQWPGL
jgi:hypothetical protein